MDNEDDSEDGAAPAVPPLDQAKSYLAYAVRSLRRRRKLAGLSSLGLALLTVAAVSIAPRTYTCTTVLAAKDNRVLDGEKTTQSLAGAAEVILSSDNISAIVDEIQLAQQWEKTLPPASRFKKRVMTLLRGEISEKDKREALVAMVQASIHVTPPGWGESKLTISADWHDAETAAQLADAADQSFLRARHVAEISTITEYIAILEGHASELRTEIQTFASQSQGLQDEKLAEAQQKLAQSADKEPARPAPVAAPATPAKLVEDLTELKAQIEAKQKALKDLEDQRQRRLGDAEVMLTELRLKFTGAHPMVVAAEKNRAVLAQDTEQLVSLRGELQQLSARLKLKSALQDEPPARGAGRAGSAQAPSATPGASNIEPLPSEVMRLMQAGNEELDPAVGAQFRTAVSKYATLRDKIGTARVDLDTAQAAFRHRYQIVIPAEAPSAPSKPRVPVLIAAGLLFSLLAGCLLAVLAELRTGRLVARWQVYRLGLPVLAEVRWPPSADS